MNTNGNAPINRGMVWFNKEGKETAKEHAEEGAMTYGLTKREHFAAMASDDFDKLPSSLQRDIVGYDQPSYEYDPGFDEMKEIKPVYNLEYAVWFAKGRSNWKVMQADALIAALNAKN